MLPFMVFMLSIMLFIMPLKVDVVVGAAVVMAVVKTYI